MAEGQESLRKAASVILLRENAGQVQVYLLRRHRKASFMSSSYVFPGGIVDEGEVDLRHTAIRELFEESGVLLSTVPSEHRERETWRKRVNEHKEALTSFFAADDLDTESLQYFSEWMTPSIEKRRYHATFYLAAMPGDQQASPDNRETVDEVWVSPEEALERRAELRLPPPQLRTCFELAKTLREATQPGLGALFSQAAQRAHTPHPILPRLLPASQVTLVLPWDADYLRAQGSALPVPDAHPIAWGPSRFVMGEGGVWNIDEA